MYNGRNEDIRKVEISNSEKEYTTSDKDVVIVCPNVRKGCGAGFSDCFGRGEIKVSQCRY